MGCEDGHKEPATEAEDPYEFTADPDTGTGTDGSRTEVPGSPFPTGRETLYLSGDPAYRFLYTVSRSGNEIWTYEIDYTSGELTHTEVTSNPYTGGLLGPVWVH